MKRQLLEQIQQARQNKQAVALLTDLASGGQCLVHDGAEFANESGLSLQADQLVQIQAMLRGARSGILADSQVFVRSYVPAYRLLIVGAVHIAQSLSRLAAECGYEVIVIDPRRAFATRQRFDTELMRVQWPDEAMAELRPDAQTAVVALSHDPKIDDPALLAALASEAFYIGALGSARSHSQRLVRLAEQGLGDDLARIHGPVGLRLGGRSHAEIAVAILAQLIQARYGNSP